MIENRTRKTFSLLLFIVLLIGSLSFVWFSEQEMLRLKEENAKQLARVLAQTYDENDEVFELEGKLLEKEGYHLYLLDSAGLLLKSSNGADLNAIKDPTIQELIRKEKPADESLAIATKLAGDKIPLAALSHLPSGQQILLIEREAGGGETGLGISQAMTTLESRITVSFFILLSLGLLFIHFISKRLMKPIEDFKDETQRIAEGDLSHRIQRTQAKELEAIAQDVNAMADQLESMSYDSLSNQSQLQAILASMNSGVIAVDSDNRILIFNAFARKIFGILTEPIGKDINDVIRRDDAEKIMRKSNEFQEFSLRHASNPVVRFKTTELVTNRRLNKGKVTVIQDVTDLKRLEQMRSQFVANVSHELKTPLTSIKGFAETLRNVEDASTRDKFLDIIDAEAQRLQRLIEDILSLSSIESHETHPTELIDAVEATSDALRLLEVQAQSKGVLLSLTVKGEPYIMGKTEMYRELIINLVDNAIKYTEAQGKVKVRLEEQKNDILLTVQDTGVGIPQEHLSRLFERFYRVDISRDRAKGGTGLGLAIVKHITLAFGGSITVDSKEGKGTRFDVRLPAHRNPNQAISTKTQTIKFND